jgi:arylsulfatase A-like enzyme
MRLGEPVLLAKEIKGSASVDDGPAGSALRATTPGSTLSLWSILALAAWFGLIGGVTDLGIIFAKRDLFHATLYYEQGKHFRWVVPAANLAVMMVPGLFVAAAARLRPGILAPRTAAWFFATMAIWGPLLRLPLYGIATLVLSAAVAWAPSRWFAYRDSGLQRFARFSLPALLALLASFAFLSHRRQAWAESQMLARLPAPSPGARNVLLIVMDTVRAQNLGLYGYNRDTTPQLTRWAKRGVRFDWALAPAPWTLPSHCSFLTGQWPSTLGAHWQPILDAAYPTLAEFLASNGYLTAGFAANTYWCSYESGMDRGFAHYEDYHLSPQAMLASTMPGRFILETLFRPFDSASAKWIRSQSRGAREINRAFLDWLTREGRRGRPFFAFLNYIDAHEPFLAPRETDAHFGRRAESSSDYAMLLEYWDRDKLKLTEGDVALAQDAYDDCIAALDREVGALLDKLDSRGVLRDTVVVVTADHGEQFGEHGVFNHGFSLYVQETHVPLLIISSGASAGLSIDEPVSLRDLPATIVDLARPGTRSNFPGVSLAECWRAGTETHAASTSKPISEVDIPLVIGPERGRGASQRGFTVSAVGDGFHYLVDVRGIEELYDLAHDPQESYNLRNEPGQEPLLNRFRTKVAVFLRDNRVTTGAAASYQEQLMKLIATWLPRPSI